MTADRLRLLMNLWPPFLCTGIRVEHIDRDWRSARVALRLRPWNRNYVGTHFGGSLFAMTDPFWMLLVKESIGRDHYVWDRAGDIEFLKPGRGTVRAGFVLDNATLATMHAQTADGGKYLHWFDTDVVDDEGDVVARVRKQIYVRRKKDRRHG
ncbi:DUF4442 domain-containing protein [Luteimonas yindakuii]|uniref:DUF4442 domain-containing protein n=1 Tax=Luteimonas yindakuii TaxID=2565782 RepID=A0A4Z1R438_9GAMM|nr:DUF4442 domain-containing protein [Luteimonas yindakuii]TKS53676.1 DUF4442 domain-containing protein [Luteimonas yindakuii]